MHRIFRGAIFLIPFSRKMKFESNWIWIWNLGEFWGRVFARFWLLILVWLQVDRDPATEIKKEPRNLDNEALNEPKLKKHESVDFDDSTRRSWSSESELSVLLTDQSCPLSGTEEPTSNCLLLNQQDEKGGVEEKEWENTQFAKSSSEVTSGNGTRKRSTRRKKRSGQKKQKSLDLKSSIESLKATNQKQEQAESSLDEKPCSVNRDLVQAEAPVHIDFASPTNLPSPDNRPLSSSEESSSLCISSQVSEDETSQHYYSPFETGFSFPTTQHRRSLTTPTYTTVSTGANNPVTRTPSPNPIVSPTTSMLTQRIQYSPHIVQLGPKVTLNETRRIPKKESSPVSPKAETTNQVLQSQCIPTRFARPEPIITDLQADPGFSFFEKRFSHLFGRSPNTH